MNQKEYELIISIFDDMACEMMDKGIYERLVMKFAEKLEIYPSFDKAKFLERLGVSNV